MTPEQQAALVELVEREAYHENTWGVVRQIADHNGRVYLLTRSGQLVNPRRDIRREAVRAGLAPSGRQWVKLRKRMQREERQLQRLKEAAA